MFGTDEVKTQNSKYAYWLNLDVKLGTFNVILGLKITNFSKNTKKHTKTNLQKKYTYIMTFPIM